MLARGVELPVKPLTQRNGVIFTSVYEDIFSRKKDGQSLLSILGDYAKDLFKPHVFIYFSFSDPWPSIVLFWYNLKSVSKIVINRLGGKAGSKTDK